MPADCPDMDRACSADRYLRASAWASLTLGLTAVALVDQRDPAVAQVVLTTALGLFFTVLLIRLAVAAAALTRRRTSLVMLFTGVLAWAVGSATLNSSGKPDLTKFPAPGEIFFLASYVAFALYLLAGTTARRSFRDTAWLDTAVVCGGTVCLTGAALISPAASSVHAGGLGLLLSLLYPMLDLVLCVLLIGQMTMRYRSNVREAVRLLIGFGLFTAADLSFITNLTGASDTYSYQWINIACWGAGFAFIVDAACRPRSPERPRALLRGMPVAVVMASMAATVVLAFEPDGSVRSHLLVPAITTLVAAAARMLFAVREAQRSSRAAALSLTDDLTGLPNRRAIYNSLDQRMNKAGPLALMLMDLDGFKDINDTLGHSAGDAVLCALAARRNLAPAGVILARLGGDEFALLADVEDEVRLYEMARTVLAAVREPISIDGIALSVDASIGITTRQAEDRQGSDLLRRADVAMYDAKRDRLGVLLYEPATDQFSRERLALGEDLRSGIDDRQLELWYQPQQEGATGRICAVEALVRWRHPTRGLLNPIEFLPVARRSGLMLALSEEIGRIAVADVSAWRAQGIDTRVALNCAAPELMSGVFLPRLADAIRAADLAPASFIIEVTEESFLAEPERAREVITELTHEGFEVSIDDYGTGFSSLSYLRDLPITEIKMDRSFVSALTTDDRSRLIVASTFHLAEALGLRMVAEGVENVQTAQELTALGVHVLQGYYCARPMELRQATAFLADCRSKPATADGDSGRDPGAGELTTLARSQRELTSSRHLHAVQPDTHADQTVSFRIQGSLPVHHHGKVRPQGCAGA